MNNTNRLGRGLSSIFNRGEEKAKNENNNIEYIDINLIKKNPFQPRTRITDETLNELADSIKTYGLIQAITVRQNNENEYELISGERRLRASIIAGLNKIPAFIKKVDSNQMLEVALVENIQRQDLDPIEIAISLEHLIEHYNLTQDSLGKKIGKSRSTISNYIRLLKLDPIIQAGLRDKIISMGHAKAIINIENQTIQLELYQNIIQNKLSVRDTESIVKQQKPNTSKKDTQITPKLSVYYQNIEKNLSDFFNQEIRLKVSKNGKGKIEIPFKSEKKLNEIIQLLQSS
ncbi:MAG: chromosome partitioning protein ParB [Flavobacteriales bacterium]|nr:chromosome partitioning protein ParB [Flavobacteriales bacterium]|tara:strand:+ start:470 stop:1336 length:867 start_codon:yes stop_codon:yes gene_type:complete